MFDDGPEAVNQHTKTHVTYQSAKNPLAEQLLGTANQGEFQRLGVAAPG
jgi:hypothetical protein